MYLHIYHKHCCLSKLLYRSCVNIFSGKIQPRLGLATDESQESIIVYIDEPKCLVYMGLLAGAQVAQIAASP